MENINKVKGAKETFQAEGADSQMSPEYKGVSNSLFPSERRPEWEI